MSKNKHEYLPIDYTMPRESRLTYYLSIGMDLEEALDYLDIMDKRDELQLAVIETKLCG